VGTIAVPYDLDEFIPGFDSGIPVERERSHEHE